MTRRRYCELANIEVLVAVFVLAFIVPLDLSDLASFLLVLFIAKCVALVTAIVLLVRHYRPAQRQVDALQILVTHSLQTRAAKKARIHSRPFIRDRR